MKKLGRFEKMINLNVSTDNVREEILKKLLEKVKHNLKNEEISEISKLSSGFMAADLVTLLKEAALKTRANSSDKSSVLELKHFQSALKLVQPMMKKEGFIDKPDTTLEDVGGLTVLKKELEK